MTNNSNAIALTALLADERVALLRADFSALGRLALQKEARMQEMQRNPPAPDILNQLKRDCARNQHLVTAARDGLTQALAALSMLMAPRHATTYGPDGQRACLKEQQQNLSRKF